MASNSFNSSDKHLWYFGAYNRKQTQEKLLGQIHGTFLVRDSKTCPGDLVLSVSENNKVSHYIINTVGNRLRIGDQEFNEIEQLLDFYKVHYLDTTTLIEPAIKDDKKACVDELSAGLTSIVNPLETELNNSMEVVQGDDYMNHPALPLKTEVRALFEFKGNDSEDLPFMKGEILEIVAKPEQNWWTAKNKAGNVGQIPVPYVEKLTSLNRMSQPLMGQSIKPIFNNRMSLPDISKHPVYAKVTLKRVPSAYDPSALALDVGDVVKVTKMNQNGQWEGQIKDRIGFFPFTHVKVLENHTG